VSSAYSLGCESSPICTLVFLGIVFWRELFFPGIPHQPRAWLHLLLLLRANVLMCLTSRPLKVLILLLFVFGVGVLLLWTLRTTVTSINFLGLLATWFISFVVSIRNLFLVSLDYRPLLLVTLSIILLFVLALFVVFYPLLTGTPVSARERTRVRTACVSPLMWWKVLLSLVSLFLVVLVLASLVSA